MAKFIEPYEDTQEMFDSVIRTANLTNDVAITVLANNKAKEIFKVTKANDLLKFRTGDDVIIIINESIFEKLDDAQKLIVVEEAIAYISYDSEKGKVIITPPDFLAHSGILRKHTYATIEVVRESIKSIYDTQNAEEQENEQITE